MTDPVSPPVPQRPSSTDAARDNPDDGGVPVTNGASASGISVFLVDDHPPIRSAMGRAFESTIDLRLCGYAARGTGAVEQVAEAAPDVAVVDLSLPDEHGLALVKALRERHPAVRVVVFSMREETIHAERALRAGAAGYLMKTEPFDELIEAIRQVANGRVYLSDEMKATVQRGGRGANGSALCFPIDELSDRERQVLDRLGRGQSVDAIAAELDLSRKTIETHRRRAKDKLGLDTVRELVQYAVQWTQSPEPARSVEA